MKKDFKNIFTKDFLKEYYLNKKMSAYKISNLYVCSINTVFKYLKPIKLNLRMVNMNSFNRKDKKTVVGEES